MSVFVLAVGALLAVAGVYEMIVGSGDILSERGWSAFIAGSVFVAGGVSTAALGLAVQAIDRLRAALLQSSVPSGLAPLAISDPPAPSPVAASSASTTPPFRTEPSVEEAPTAPLTAAPPIGAVASEKQPISPAATQVPLVSYQEHAASEGHSSTPESEVRHDDWLNHSFAELEREVSAFPDEDRASARSQPAFALHEVREQETLEHETNEHAPALPIAPSPPEPAPSSPAEFAGIETSPPDRNHSEAVEAAAGSASIAAREEPQPSESQVIGRYESEGTSYVMYADGSIDAQSEAGVYRFASMAELKAFIEG